MIREVFLIRAIACLSIVILHSLGYVNQSYGVENNAFELLRLFLTFGTPTFIFISELILAKNYRDKKLPQDFLSKRFKFIFLPYITFALFYALLSSFSSPGEIIGTFIYNLFGGYHGYFILIIFQFYLLHIFFSRYINRLHPLRVLLFSFLINILYLSVFNFTNPPNHSIGQYIWERGYWLPFIGWFFYFTLAYYCGQYYERFTSYLVRYKKIILLLPLGTISIVITMYLLGYLPDVGSKRVDILLMTTSLFFLMCLLFNNTKPVPRIIVMISQYSFGIYLLHRFFIQVSNKLIGIVGLNTNWYLDAMFLTIGSVILSIVSVYFVNKLWVGKYLVGKIGAGYATSHTKTNPKTLSI